MDAALNGYNLSGVGHMQHLNKHIRDSGALFTNYTLAYVPAQTARTPLLASGPTRAHVRLGGREGDVCVGGAGRGGGAGGTMWERDDS